MALPLKSQFTVFDAIDATTTARIPTGGSDHPEHAQSIILEVLGGASANFTLDIQGRTHPDGTFTNLDYIQIWQAGAAALANAQLTVNDQTVRFYLIPNCPSFVQLVATFTAGTLTIHGCYTSEVLQQWLTTTATGGIEISGDVAHDAADSGNPVKIGYASTANISGLPDVGSDDRVDGRGTLKGAMIVAGGVTLTADGALASYTSSLSEGDEERALAVGPYGLVPDGATDRLRTAGDTANSGLGVLQVSPAGHLYDLVEADEQIAGAAAHLHTVTIHDVTTAGVITIYDNTAESGTVIATLTLVAGESFFTLHYDVACPTGIFIGYDSTVAASLTASSSI